VYRKSSNKRRVTNKRRVSIKRRGVFADCSNKRWVSIKRQGVIVTNVLIDISIQLFSQLYSTQLLLLLLSHGGTPLNAGGYLPIVRINAGGIY